jgi:hypothetical protein
MAQGVALKLRFEYLYELNVVGVRVEHGDETLLHNLYPKDIGLTSPNPANRYLFNQYTFLCFFFFGLAESRAPGL